MMTPANKDRGTGSGNTDSWWVFYYVCRQVGYALPHGCNTSPLCPGFDFELWPIVPYGLDGRPIFIESILIGQMDSGVSGKGKLVPGKLRLSLWHLFFSWSGLAEEDPTKGFCSVEKPQKSSNIKQQITSCSSYKQKILFMYWQMRFNALQLKEKKPTLT